MSEISDEINLARSYFYEFLAYPLFFDEKMSGFERFKEQAKFLANSPISDENLSDFDEILNASAREFKAEQNAVLFNFGYGNVPLSASFYDEGRDDGRKRLAVIEILKKTKYRRDSDKFGGSEDYLGFIFKLSATLLQEKNTDLANELFEKITNDFADEFIKLLKNHKSAKILKSYAKICESFIELERNILGLKAPKFDRQVAEIAMAQRPQKKKKATPKSKQMWNEIAKLSDD